MSAGCRLPRRPALLSVVGRVVVREGCCPQKVATFRFFIFGNFGGIGKCNYLLSTHAYVSMRFARAPLKGTLRDSPTVRESARSARPWRVSRAAGVRLSLLHATACPHQTRRNYSNLTSSLCRRLAPNRQHFNIQHLPAGSARIQRAWRPWPQRVSLTQPLQPFCNCSTG